MEGLVSRVGLQLLLEPQSTALIARGACVVAGAVLPVYCTHKALVAPTSPPGRASATAALRERWLRYWCIAGALYAAERVLEGHLESVTHYYTAKLCLLLWLQAREGNGASLLYEGHLRPWLRRYEGKMDVVLEAGEQAAELVWNAPGVAALRSSLGLVLRQLCLFCRWLATPDPLAGDDTSSAALAHKQHAVQPP